MIYFLSDAHLGSLAIPRGWAHQKKLINMLEMMSKDAASIYMLGDMFDFWFEYFRHDKAKRQYAPFCKEIHSLVKRGIHVHFFIGNHDQWTFGGLAQMTGAEIHYEPCTILRYGKSLPLGVLIPQTRTAQNPLVHASAQTLSILYSALPIPQPAAFVGQ